MPRAPRHEFRSVRQVALALDCSPSTVRRWANRLGLRTPGVASNRMLHATALKTIRAARRAAAAARKQPR